MTGLAIECHPPATTPSNGRVVLLHGFTQTRRSWDGVVDALSDRFETVTVDAPGHGESSSLQLDLASTAAELARQVGPATYLGYSMGGRLALHVAVTQPGVVDRLVLVSASPGLASGEERAARRVTDDHLATEIERNGVDAFLERWLALPLFARLPADPSGLDDRRTNTPAGLASSLRLAGTGAQESLWDRLETLTMPVLLVVGEHDPKFRSIAVEMAAHIPQVSVDVIPGAGHVVHLEQHTAFVAALRRWLGA